MAYLVVRHTVKDYATWKPIFDEHGATRAKAGGKGGLLFRSVDNPNDLTILFEWDSKENAMKFTQSDDLRRTMERAGVIGIPDVSFLDKIEDFKR